MQPSANDAKSGGTAAVDRTDSPAGVSASANPAGAKKEPRLRPEPTPIFKGRTFYIAPGLPSHFETDLKEEIELWDGLIESNLSKAYYVLHTGTEESDRIQSAAVAKLHAMKPPKIRSYHWFFACIHARPPKPLPKSEFIREMPIFTVPVDSPNGEERTRPTAFYLTKNMPPFAEYHETTAQQALLAVAALIEVNGGEISRTRAKADILILDPSFGQAQRFIEQMRPDQEAKTRHDLTQIVKKKKPYLPGYWSRRGNTGKEKAGPSKATLAPDADQSRAIAGKGTADGYTSKPRPPPQTGRTEYTLEDDVHIVRWLTYHHPDHKGWKAVPIYQALCDKRDPKHLPWATRHSAQSWHERVRKRYANFVSRSDKLLVDGVGLDRQLRTRAERVGAGLSEDRDRNPVQDWVRATNLADVTAEIERPPKKVEKGKGREADTEDDDVAEEVDSFATSQVEPVAANPKAQAKRKEQDERPRSPSQDPAMELEDHRPKRAKHRNENPSAIASSAGAMEQVVEGDFGDQATTEMEDRTMATQTAALPEPSHYTMPENSVEEPIPNATGNDAADPNQSSGTVRANVEDPSHHTANPVTENGQTVDIPQGDTSDLVKWTMDTVVGALGPILASPHAAIVPPSPTHSQAYTEENSMDLMDDEALAHYARDQFNLLASHTSPAGDEIQKQAQRDPSRRGDAERPLAPMEGDGEVPSGRPSTHLSESERRVNDLVFDNQVASNRQPVDVGVEAMVTEAEPVLPNPTSIVVTTEVTSTVVSTRVEPKVATKEMESTEEGPSTNSPLARPSAVPRGSMTPATTTKPATKGKKRIANPQRAAELIKSTIERYGVDVKTVLAAMKSVAAASPEGKIDVTEVWRVIAEGKGQRD